MDFRFTPRHFGRFVSLALSGALLLPLHAQAPASAAASATPQAQASTPVAGSESQTTTSTPAPANGAAAAQDAAPNAAPATDAKSSGNGNVGTGQPTLKQEIANLPPLTNTGIDAEAASKQILAHLNAVLRFYRTAVTSLQKVGEPSDVLYQEQSAGEATQIAQYAFKAAGNQASLLSKVAGAPPDVTGKPANGGGSSQAQTEAERMTSLRANASQQITQLEAQDDAIDKQIAKARAKDVPALRLQKQQIEGGLELQRAMVDALGRVGNISEPTTEKGLAGDIDRLQRSAPELLSKTGKPAAPAVLENVTSSRDAGVSTQAIALFQLLSTRRSIDQQIRMIDLLAKQADDLRTPIVKILRSTVQQGQDLSQGAVNAPAPGSDAAQQLSSTRKSFDTLTATFNVMANATLPLSQEIMLLQQDRGTLTTWDNAVESEYKLVLRSLLLRVISMAIALGLILLLGNIWGRATLRYVHDLRRRRQLLVVRRFVVGFLSGLVLIFGFVTQFSSLATFAGFISAGIAVGLQTILLSVAAYFFIVGRYGVRVGDRITVAGVTGDVIEVGLARFYMMELTGTGTDLHSTGRVAVFANSVLFQTGTPLYKQMPGTEYAWHELTVKLNAGADVHTVSDAVLKDVNDVFSTYSDRIAAQHQQVEAWMGTALEAPKVTMQLHLAEDGLQIVVLFPVELRKAGEVDQQIAHALLESIRSNEQLKNAVAGTPVIKPSIKP